MSVDEADDVVKQEAGDLALQVDLDAAGKVNFASSQNGASILRKLVLRNAGDMPLQGLTVEVSCSPALIRPRSWVIDRLGAGEELALRDLDTPLDTVLLRGLNEAETGQLTLSVRTGEESLLCESRDIVMLARDEWAGLGEMASLLAAFVSPNDPVVAGILKEAARLLEATGQSGAMDGYQSQDPARAWMLAGAIWSAVTGMGLTYAVPPASFEARGQKVRDPGRIRAEGLATCLDSTLLLAACYEAAGLNPVVFFSEGHAWAGVWLASRDFGAVSEPDVMAVRKAVDARDLVMMETTLLTHRPSVGFEDAVSTARGLISELKEHLFRMAIDIRRARGAQITPLASHRVAEDDAETEEIPASPAALPRPLDLGQLPGEITEEVPATPAGRISRWQRKLLDLSLRNRLLNFRDSKQTLPFLCPNVAALEDRLAGGRTFRTLPLKEEDPLAGRDLLTDKAPEILAQVASDAFEKGQLAVPLTRRDLDRRLLELHRRAKSDLQEGGTNTLFLAAGFLRWKKSGTDERSYRAPLVLIPVTLSRRSAQSEFVVGHHEDDVRFNTTLLEFLKRDFDLSIPELEGDLPRDESGYDLPRIFALMRQKVRDVAGFEVVEELALSTFSFAKFLMWKDLVERTDTLRESRLVRHLVDNPAEPFLPPDAPAMPEPRDIDRRRAPRDLFTPLPADSSQLAAVLAAEEGHDFVLVGPPGTGKSQTITNIISQCLAVGKTVLFVAEKAAALDVVHRRLSASGLADAVLELHSSKSDRKSVLAQLGRSWDRATTAADAEWIRITDDLQMTREQLNTYVEALHRKGPQGFSVFEAIGQATGHAPAPFSLSFASRDAHDVDSYAHLRTLAATLGRCHQIIAGRPPLPLVKATDWSFGWQSRLLEQAADLGEATRVLSEMAATLAQVSGLRGGEACQPEDLETLGALSAIPAEGADVSWALGRDIEALTREADALSALLSTYHGAISAASARYPMDRLEAMPLEKLDTDWRMAQTKIWPMSAFAKSSVRKLLQTYADSGQADPARDIEALSDARRARQGIMAHGLSECPVVAGVDTDPVCLGQWVEEARTLRQQLDPLGAAVTDEARWQESMRALAARETGALREAITGFREALEMWEVRARSFTDTAGADPRELELNRLAGALDDLVANRAHLQDWTTWVEARAQAEASGLGALVEALEDGRVADDAAEEAFASAYAAWWLPRAMDAEDALRGFSHWSHEDAIRHFRDLVGKSASLAAGQVLERVQHGLPARDMVPKRSELGTLRHQLNLQRPSMPIRTLIAGMPESFTRLAPCVLMSPLSVAQYLPAGQAAFDVVIFDEASQITTWDAIGAIARGKQAIIVGDPKQLPPTNFFGRSDVEDEDLPEEDRDLASILDEVSSAGIPTRELNWHYRSRDESLIAFSNWKYYGGRLVTFPAPSTSSEAVKLHQIDGTYGRGQGRTNVDEANAIVRMIVRRLTDWLARPEEQRLTLGVITFNAEQQGLILDLLDEERRKNPDLEWFFEDAREEPVIVKNLENIQGDERDVMLFSITFGPDAAGKLSMAFGALNGEGGEKRLNVAVTRARQELHVFASLRADQIDLSRTRATGVKHLKAFLDYAARGPVALPAQNDGSLGPVENVFEEAIMRAIEAKGWELRPQIGVSGFRIDLGVVHPDHVGVFLAGIECDGATYHGSATARDRDKVRQAVLESLGWTIFRIWSTDWFRDPQAVAERMHEALTDHLAEDRSRRAAEEAEREAAADAPAATTDEIPEETGTAHTEEPELSEVVDDGPSEATADGVREEPLISGMAAMAPPPRSVSATPDPERFYDESYLPVLEELIAEIVDREGPMPLTLLGKRVSALHGWHRTGRRIAEQVSRALGRVERHPEGEVDFLWFPGRHAARIPFRHGLDRSVRDISRAEIAGLREAHAAELSRSADPVRDLAREAGIARLSADARSYLESCLGDD